MQVLCNYSLVNNNLNFGNKLKISIYIIEIHFVLWTKSGQNRRKEATNLMKRYLSQINKVINGILKYSGCGKHDRVMESVLVAGQTDNWPTISPGQQVHE